MFVFFYTDKRDFGMFGGVSAGGITKSLCDSEHITAQTWA